jgi:SagB-type dehydrogenase family enzyme
MNKKLLKFILFILIIIVLLISTCTVSNGYNKIDKGATVTQRQEQDKQINGQNENIEKGEEVILPKPRLKSNISLEEALNNRRSVRQFKSVDLKLEDISQILWAAQGITEISTGFRTAPSAGALYPLELFIVKSDGLFHYVPEGHKLKKLSSSDLRSELMKASLSQKSVSEAPVDIVITAIFERTTVKYGDRGVRYIYMEAGHACQNILIEAVVLELGAVPIGAFSDTDVQKVLGLPKDYTPLYVVPVGYIK